MTLEEAVELLREARESVRFEARERANTDTESQASQERFALLSRIDAALAKSEKPVHWAKNPQTLEWYGKVEPFFVEVHWNKGWKWAVVSSGESTSEAEAKAAALKVARGL